MWGIKKATKIRVNEWEKSTGLVFKLQLREKHVSTMGQRGGGIGEDVGVSRGQGTTMGRAQKEFCKLQVPFPGSSRRLKAAKPTKGRTVWEALEAGGEVGGKKSWALWRTGKRHPRGYLKRFSKAGRAELWMWAALPHPARPGSPSLCLGAAPSTTALGLSPHSLPSGWKIWILMGVECSFNAPPGR